MYVQDTYYIFVLYITIDKSNVHLGRELTYFKAERKNIKIVSEEANSKVLKRKSENFINQGHKIDLGGKVLDFC